MNSDGRVSPRAPYPRPACRAIAPRLSPGSPRYGATSSAEQARDRDQRDRSEKGDDNTLQVEASHHIASQHRATDETANNRANDAEHNVADKAVRAAHKVT